MDPHEVSRLDALMESGEAMDNHDWHRVFVEQMRYRGAGGTAIGEAWAEVESHCAESGQRAVHAFGDPTDYADQLAGPARLWPAFRHQMLAVALGSIALACVALLPWTLARPAVISWGTLAQVLAFLLFGLVTTAVYLWSRSSTGRRVAGFMAAMAVWQLSMPALRSWDATAFTASAWQLWLLAALLVAGATWATVRQVGNHVVDPRGADDPAARWWLRVAPWLVPALALGILLVRAIAHL
ncbi:hypothetical protein GCM10009599_03090 [Luteococcus peritonei]